MSINMNNPTNKYVGQVDVDVTGAGPGAWRFPLDPENPNWDSGDSTLLVGDIADHERMSIAELTIRVAPHATDAVPIEVSVEMTPGDVDELIAALQAIKVAHLDVRKTWDDR